MLRLRKHIASIWRDRSGFTLVEIMVASLLLSIGLATTVSLISSGNRANDSAKRQQSAAAVAQRELERLGDLSYHQLSLTSTPSSSSDPDSPLNRVEGTQFTTETGNSEELVIGGEDASVAPGPEAVSSSFFRARQRKGQVNTCP